MRGKRWIGLALALACLGLGGCKEQHPRVIPVSTSSDEARELYFKGRDALEGLRSEEAHAYFARAVREDPEFALAHLGLAESAPTEKEFGDSLRRAMHRSRTVTEGERLLIRAVHARTTHNLNAEFEYSNQAATRYPDDERARLRLADFYLRGGNTAEAIRGYRKALDIAPEFTLPYLRLGEAYRIAGNFREAENALGHYVELNRSEPAAHNSLARLLMKAGRFEASIAEYEEALRLDPDDGDAPIGIGNNQLFLGRIDEARAKFRELLDRTADDAIRREALRWVVATYLHEEATGRALEELQSAVASIEPDRDPLAVAELLELMGNVLLESGRPDQAMARFAESLDLIERANISEPEKKLARGRHVYYEGRVAIANDDLATAREKISEYRAIVGQRRIPGAFEKFNELKALIQLAEGDDEKAVRRLLLVTKKNPRIIYLTALAYRDLDANKSRNGCKRLVNFNEPDFELAYVRAKAQRMLADL
jgi:tetratricopeptide (TPR) repeat protein